MRTLDFCYSSTPKERSFVILPRKRNSDADAYRTGLKHNLLINRAIIVLWQL